MVSRALYRSSQALGTLYMALAFKAGIDKNQPVFYTMLAFAAFFYYRALREADLRRP